MNDWKWREFVEDADGRGSASRLNMVIGVIVGALVVCYMTIADKLTEGIFGIFMLATGGVYGWGKYRESVERVEQTKAESPTPPAKPTVQINQPDKVNVA